MLRGNTITKFYFEHNWSVKANMVSSRMKRQSDRRFFNQLECFDQIYNIDKTVNDGQENAKSMKVPVTKHFPVVIPTINQRECGDSENLGKMFKWNSDREMGNFVVIVEDRIQNAILTAIDSKFTPKIELAIRSINASSDEILPGSWRSQNVGFHRDFCRSWKRMRLEQCTTCV